MQPIKSTFLADSFCLMSAKVYVRLHNKQIKPSLTVP